MSCAVDHIEHLLQDALAEAAAELPGDSQRDGIVRTASVFADLARAWPGPLSPEHRDRLEHICRKLAVTRTLLACYDACWKPTDDKTPLPEKTWTLATATLLAWSTVPEQLGPDGKGLALKFLNAALYAMDACPTVPDTLRTRAESQLVNLTIPERVSERRGSVPPIFSKPLAPSCVRIAPLTVLAYEGPCARAYLAAMRRAGLRPERIILLVLSEHPASRKPVGRWFPGRFRSWYAEKVQDIALNFWPRRLLASRPDLLGSIGAGLAPILESPAALIREMYNPFRYEAYADRVERLIVRDLRDEALRRHLQTLGPTTVLFTGGGILPAGVIDLPGLRFLHVHPGHLPFVRGADGLLWSMLVRGCPAMSGFYLAAGLDTGDVVAVRDYPPLSFGQANRPRPDDQTLYRAIFAFVDPLLRADLLVSGVLGSAPDPQRLETTRQDPSCGVTYHFLHPRLRERALARLFPHP